MVLRRKRVWITCIISFLIDIQLLCSYIKRLVTNYDRYPHQSAPSLTSNILQLTISSPQSMSPCIPMPTLPSISRNSYTPKYSSIAGCACFISVYHRLHLHSEHADVLSQAQSSLTAYFGWWQYGGIDGLAKYVSENPLQEG
ncbi:hypothetical protein GQ43DRAFT_110951 [Delitschia confertaspora ATCC 74209]|uniref:Uncharacterized protein n=1 Tax=Delitschia confertaspora ATCC 74209 TaxID=1513339 RepID=A0A9P4JM21_9PLEO|nr:hypothetical protein GQ43DRAFT_110951 [Delitschia confertaspora ATCC 74209]